jgi:hypothetical protein
MESRHIKGDGISIIIANILHTIKTSCCVHALIITQSGKGYNKNEKYQFSYSLIGLKLSVFKSFAPMKLPL